MWFFFAVALPLLVVAVVLALRVMPAKGTSLLVLLDVGLAWFSALSAMVLVPTDVSTTLEGGSPELLAVWWRTAYWYGFIVQFTLLPFHQEYSDSGHFHVWDRVVTALRNNVIFYAVLAGAGAGGLVLLLLTGELKANNVVGFCIAASNAFGLIAGIFVMGYGLVAIPKQLWRTANIRGQQRLLYHRAGVQAEKAIAARSELNKARAAVHKVSELFSRRDPMRKYMDQIIAMAAEYEADLGPITSEADENMDLDFFDRQDLGRLRRRLRKGIEGFQRERELYLELVHEFLKVEDVMQNLKHGSPFQSTTHGELTPLLSHLEWWWKCMLRAWVFRILAVVAAVLSAAVVVAEATITDKLPNLSVFSLILHRVQGGQFTKSLVTFVLLAYPCIAAYYALFRLGRFGFYLLVPGHTNAYSLLTNALLMCRFAPPLAFNFMAALALPASKHDQPHDVTETVFYHEFGRLMMRQPVIGFEFTTYAPLALLPYVMLLVLNVFNRVAAFCLRSPSITFEDDWETRSPYTASGTRLLAIEVENHTNGRPLGLTISPQGSDLEAGNRRSRWWNFSFRKPNNLLSNDHLAASQAGPPISPEVAEARGRLSRALGREPPPSSRQTLPPAPTRPKTSVRGLFGLGRGSEDGVDETTRLVQGESSSRGPTGDLDSIFARIEEPQDGGARRAGRTSSTLNVESDGEEAPGGPSRWFRRGGS